MRKGKRKPLSEALGVVRKRVLGVRCNTHPHLAHTCIQYHDECTLCSLRARDVLGECLPQNGRITTNLWDADKFLDNAPTNSPTDYYQVVVASSFPPYTHTLHPLGPIALYLSHSVSVVFRDSARSSVILSFLSSRTGLLALFPLVMDRLLTSVDQLGYVR